MAEELRVRPVRDRRPLSVQVYDQLVEALRKQSRPGDAIPPEIELSAELGVSRTVLREALRLLEEDGVIERGVDPRRRQLARAESKPPSFNAPLEEMLKGSVPLTIKVIRTEALAPTSWSRGLLELAPDENRLICRESLFLAGDEPVASALEIVPPHVPHVPVTLNGHAGSNDAGETLLAALGPQFRSKCVTTLWRIAAGSSVASRTGFNRLRGDCHVTSVTTVLSRHGKPVFLAKHLLRLDLVALSMGEPPDGFDPGDHDSP
jgi:GntR family transcriptional regulator